MTTREALFILVSISLRKEADKRHDFNQIDWKELYTIACQQGVAGIVWNGIEIQCKSGALPIPLDIKIFWHGMMKKIESENKAKRDLILEFTSKIYPLQGVVLKGIDYARYWDNPLHRTYGDLDIWSNGKQKEITEAAIRIGSTARGDSDHKHNEIDYKTLHIENHRTFIDTDTLLKHKQDGILHQFIEPEQVNIGNTELTVPGTNFTALFMLKHLQNHFLYEGTRMRLVMDWVYFIAKEAKNIDWELVNPAMQELHIKNLADLLSDYGHYLNGEKDKTKEFERLEELFFEKEMDRRLDLTHSTIRFIKRTIKRFRWFKYL